MPCCRERENRNAEIFLYGTTRLGATLATLWPDRVDSLEVLIQVVCGAFVAPRGGALFFVPHKSSFVREAANARSIMAPRISRAVSSRKKRYLDHERRVCGTSFARLTRSLYAMGLREANDAGLASLAMGRKASVLRELPPSQPSISMAHTCLACWI